jgi:hypothetical protein
MVLAAARVDHHIVEGTGRSHRLVGPTYCLVSERRELLRERERKRELSNSDKLVDEVFGAEMSPILEQEGRWMIRMTGMGVDFVDEHDERKDWRWLTAKFVLLVSARF